MFDLNSPAGVTNPYYKTGELFTTDLHFGHIVTYDFVFSCNKNIIEMYLEDALVNTPNRKDSNYLDCVN